MALNQERQQRAGKISHINPKGVAYISSDGNDFGFTFDKIANYRGQSAHELNLKPGSDVLFNEDEGKVSSVEIADRAA